MSRIKKLENHYQKQLIEHKVKDVSNFIQSIVDADITKGKYARFLIDAFLNNKFLKEDLVGGLESTVGQAISLFDKHKGKLPVEQRSVYALDKETKLPLYQSPGDLWKAVKQFQGELSGKELKKEEQEQVYRETEFVYKDEETGFQIISPLTENSAKWWGKGTRWCTSAENNNQFENYVKDAPLLILLMPTSSGTAGNGEKLQLWINGNEVQFMNEADNAVILEYIEQYWTILEPLCLWLNDLRFIPEKYLTEEVCKLAVQQDCWALKYIPEELRTEELCKLAVKQDGWTLKYVPEKLRTKELCELAVKNNGYALQFVPENLKTKDLCELAVKNKGYALRFISEELKTPEICKLAVKQDGYALEYTPKTLRTEELYKIVVQQNGEVLFDIPYNLRTKELCELAVKKNGRALKHVPKKHITKELCELAVQQNGIMLKIIPNKFITHELCKLAVEQNGEVLFDIPEELRTYELCEVAVKQNGLTLEYVPEHLKTIELCELAIRQNIDAEHYVPEKHKAHTEISKLRCEQNKKEKIPKCNMSKYQKIFQELKECFSQNILSLDNK